MGNTLQLIVNILLQGKLELITGATASLMKLQLFDDNDKLVCELCDDTATLGSASVRDGYRLHVRVGSWLDCSASGVPDLPRIVDKSTCSGASLLWVPLGWVKKRRYLLII